MRGYLVLRSSDGKDYAPVGSVGPRSATYLDTGVRGLGIRYWYEIEARSTSGSSVSGAVSATTPLLCFSAALSAALSDGAASGRKAGGDVEHRDRAGEDGDRGDIAFGVYLDDVEGPYQRV